MNDLWHCILVTVLVVIVFVFISGFINICEQSSLPGHIAHIEQLRKDSQNVSQSQSEDVVGQVTQLNMLIKEKQVYNNVWWADLAIPDKWDDIKTIDIPTNITK